jgi:hypothetical protein
MKGLSECTHPPSTSEKGLPAVGHAKPPRRPERRPEARLAVRSTPAEHVRKGVYPPVGHVKLPGTQNVR